MPKHKPRYGGPSAAFLERKATEALAAQKVPPKTGHVRILLDDDRACPPGWTLARTPDELWDLIEALEPGRIRDISLDWHLGADVPDGEAVTERLIEIMRVQPALFSALDGIHLHSDRIDKAGAMCRAFERLLDEEPDELPFFFTHVGRPW